MCKMKGSKVIAEPSPLTSRVCSIGLNGPSNVQSRPGLWVMVCFTRPIGQPGYRCSVGPFRKQPQWCYLQKLLEGSETRTTRWCPMPAKPGEHCLPVNPVSNFLSDDIVRNVTACSCCIPGAGGSEHLALEKTLLYLYIGRDQEIYSFHLCQLKLHLGASNIKPNCNIFKNRNVFFSLANKQPREMYFQDWCRESTLCITFLYHLLSHFSTFTCHLKATGRLLWPHPSHLYSSRDEGGKDFLSCGRKDHCDNTSVGKAKNRPGTP